MRLIGRWAVAVTLLLLCCSAVARADTPPASYVYWTYNPLPMGGLASAAYIARAGMDGSSVDPTYMPNSAIAVEPFAVAGPYVYWIDHSGNHSIARQQLNGSDSPDLTFISLSSDFTINDIAIQGSYIYFTWFDSAAEEWGIGRSTLDGVNVQTTTFVTLPAGLDASAGKLAVNSSYIFFGDGNSGQPTEIGRANIDGTNVNENFIQPSGAQENGPYGLAADNSYVYWGQDTTPGQGQSVIGRASATDPTSVNHDFIPVAGGIRRLAVYGGWIFWDDFQDSPGMTFDGSTIGTAELNSASPSPNDDLITGLYSPESLAVPAPTLTVNSTLFDGDEAQAAQGVCNADPGGPTQVCTLPQAILVSNATGGQPISFDIANGSGNTFDGTVPQIKNPTGVGMPPITAPATIDGTTQPGGKVELSGAANSTAVTYGLQVGANGAGTTITGMVINGYKDQLALDGGHDTIRGDWLDSTPAGTAAATNPLGTSQGPGHTSQIGVALNSSGSQIGGPAPGQGNVFATGWVLPNSTIAPAAAITDTVAQRGNVIQGNRIGVEPGNEAALVDAKPAAAAVPEAGVILNGSETLGGSSAGDGNTIAPNALIGGGSVVQGNTFLGPVDVSGKPTIGGATSTPGTGAGNTFLTSVQLELSTDKQLELDTGTAAVQGNKFTDDPEGGIVVATDHATIGGGAPDLGNLIKDDATDHLPDGASSAGIEISGNGNRVEHNVLQENGNDGAVAVYSGDGNTITANTMIGNTVGIALGHGYQFNTDVSSAHGGPNDGEYYPILFSNTADASSTTVTGRIQQPGSFTVDLYGVDGCGGSPQGNDYIGSEHTSSITGGDDFTLKFGPLGPGDGAIVATVTASSGSTSEFSQCLSKGKQANSFLGYGVTPASSSVPVTSGASATADIAAKHKTQGKVGHGTVTLTCPPRTTKACSGTLVIKTTSRHPTTIAKLRFKIDPGFRKPLRFTVPASVFTKLQRRHKLKVNATTTAHDGAKHPHHKTKRFTLTLVYKKPAAK
jgi:parallel beta-helix repeat protein